MKLTAMQYHQIGRFVARKLNSEAIKSILDTSLIERQPPERGTIANIYSQIIGNDKVIDDIHLFIGIVYKVYDPYALDSFVAKHNNLRSIIADILCKKPNEISKILAVVRVKYQHVKSFKNRVDSFVGENVCTIDNNVLDYIEEIK